MIQIEVNKVIGDVPINSNIIEAAAYLGVDIPRFCYHKKLSIAANCRMCLVEVTGLVKLVPACATKVQLNMVVSTTSEAVMTAQRAVMEFLLINHPLDCPICDRGGECDLQDISFKYGSSKTRFVETKRTHVDIDVGPIVYMNINRCILCTRCIRFGVEIAGVCDFGKIGRGVHSKITTFLQRSLRSNLSGNVVDLCPVGALGFKPFKFKSRPWELVRKKYISLHDCLGSNQYIHIQNGSIYRVTPCENDFINETWLSDKDRFGYEGLQSKERLSKPLLKINGEWAHTTLQSALEEIVTRLQITKDNFGVEAIGVIASPNSTLEEFYLLQKVFRGFGITNIDHRITEVDFSFYNKSLEFFPGFVNLTSLEKKNVIILVGFDVSNEQPLLGTRILKQKRSGGLVFSISSTSYRFTFEVDSCCINISIVESLKGVLKYLYKLKESTEGVSTMLLINKTINQEEQFIAEALLNSGTSMFLLGHTIKYSTEYSSILYLCSLITELSGSEFCIIQEGANNLGGILSGCVPGISLCEPTFPQEPGTLSSGLNTYEMFKKSLKFYCLFGIEPDKDIPYHALAIESLNKADCVVAFSAFDTAMLRSVADVIIPINAFYEVEGSFFSITGLLQEVRSLSVTYIEGVEQGWAVLNKLGNYLGSYSFTYTNILMLTKEIAVRFKDLKYTGGVFGRTTYTPYDFLNVNVTKVVDYTGCSTEFISQDSVSRRSMSLCKLK